jgi:hypothetical protein
MRDFGCFTLLVLGTFLSAAVLVFVVTYSINHIDIGPQIDRIEQLRSDAAVVDPIQAEDVIGQVTETNQLIRANQAYNRIPIIGWAVPDEWDTIDPIEVPR